MNKFFLFISLFVNLTLFAQLLLPRIADSSAYIDHTCFQLEYSEEHEQAKWTYHLLTREMTKSDTERSDRFLIDPQVKTGSATDADYKGSGYDRGHLVPAADMAFSEECMNKSFYYSNMSPQHPSFNRGIWKKLEVLVRYWAYKYDSIHVVSGPILTYPIDSLNRIGPNDVTVPKEYFKAVVIYRMGIKKGIGFILPNESHSNELKNEAVTIDEIEKRTGIDLFTELEDSDEIIVEKQLDLNAWEWKANPIIH